MALASVQTQQNCQSRFHRRQSVSLSHSFSNSASHSVQPPPSLNAITPCLGLTHAKAVNTPWRTFSLNVRVVKPTRSRLVYWSLNQYCSGDLLLQKFVLVHFFIFSFFFSLRNKLFALSVFIYLTARSGARTHVTRNASPASPPADRG